MGQHWRDTEGIVIMPGVWRELDGKSPPMNKSVCVDETLGSSNNQGMQFVLTISSQRCFANVSSKLHKVLNHMLPPFKL